MNIVAEIDKLITLAAELPKEGLAAGPFRNGLFRLRKAFGEEIKTFEARISAMEADSKDKILATQNDLLSAQLHEAQEEIERLKYDIAKLEKKQSKTRDTEEFSELEEKLLIHLEPDGFVSYGADVTHFMQFLKVGSALVKKCLNRLESANLVIKRESHTHGIVRWQRTPLGDEYLVARGLLK